ncbi:MAG: phosphatidylglycerophosphatase A [Candidatus Synoicihabitans palmerolidicus]|nr:phosphatidylglycerophosphatase A [Candidatus Synoicihabitans palmerolidicus]
MKLKQPIWPRLLPTQMVLNFARLGPVGLIRKAPGTWGSLAGLLYFTVFFYDLGTLGTLLFGSAGIYLAVAVCGEAEFRLGRRDPGEVVLDEFVVIPFCFLEWRSVAAVLPNWAAPWVVFLAGFALFRLFDILKPLGIGRLQDLPDGWGVVADDVVAALATCLTLHALAWEVSAMS